MTGGTRKIVVPPSLTDLDPVTIYDWGGIALIQQLCEYLLDLDDHNALVPKLAVSWSANEDAFVWTSKLREGVKFRYGSPFEAADVVATMDRRVNPKSGSTVLAALYGILAPGGTKAVDAYTVSSPKGASAPSQALAPRLERRDDGGGFLMSIG